MSDIKLFRTNNGTVEELKGTSVQLEKSLQTLIEQHLEAFLGIRFLASEYSTGKVHGGRIDTLGIDENGYPVIIEYKRAVNENVVNQGLYYLDWLMDHKADFKLLVMEKFGKEQSDIIEWSSPRLLCIAGDFTNYDEHAVKQISRNIELLRYRRYEKEFLLLELVHTSPGKPVHVVHISNPAPKQPLVVGDSDESDVSVVIQGDDNLRDLFENLKILLSAFGDDVRVKSLKNYIAFTRIRTFASIRARPKFQQLIIDVNVDPIGFMLEADFTYIGHDNRLRIRIRNVADLEKAKPLLFRSYNAS